MKSPVTMSHSFTTMGCSPVIFEINAKIFVDIFHSTKVDDSEFRTVI